MAKYIGNSPLKNTGKKKDEEVGLPKVDYKKLAKGVSNFAQLQSIYGHDRMATRSGQLYRQRIDEAFKQYKQSFPEASKSDFLKNAWTTDVKDEENITPYQQAARKAYEEADAIRQEEENAFREAQIENWNSLDTGTQRTRTVLLAKQMMNSNMMIPDNLKKMLKRHQNFGADVKAFNPEEMKQVNAYLEREARHNPGTSKWAAEQLQTLHNKPKTGKGTVKLDEEVDTAAGYANRVNSPLNRGRAASKARENARTKAAHEQARQDRSAKLDATHASEDKVGWDDIGTAAAGAIPFVGGALVAKDLAGGAVSSIGSNAGAAGDALETAGKAGLKSAGRGALAAAGQVAGIVGAADAAVAAGDLYNQKMVQEMTPEQLENYKRTGSTSGRRRAPRRSPMKKMGDSPFKATGQTVNFRPLQQAPVQNYATLSQRIGASVDQAMQEQIDRKIRARKAEEDMLRSEMLKTQYAEMKTRQVEQFIVPADTGTKTLDNAIDAASRSLVDQQAALVNQMKAGEIDPDEFAQKSALLKSQVPGIKNFKETMNKNIEGYVAALANGQISNSTDPETLAMYQALNNPGGNAQLAVDEQGIVTFTGTFQNPRTGEEQPFSIPASGIDQMPKVNAKVDPPEKTLMPIMAEVSKNFSEFNDTALAQVEASFDDIVANGGDNALKSLAMDYFGNVEAGGMDFDGDGNPDILNELTTADVNRLATQYNEDGESMLESIVRDAYTNRAKTYFNAANYQRQKQELDIKQRELQNQRTQQIVNAGDQALLDAEQQRLQAEQAAKADQSLVESIPNNPKDAVEFLRTQGIGNVRYDKDHGYVITSPTNAKTPQQILGQDIQALRAYLLRNSKSPIKKVSKSPLKRLTDWMDNLING